MIKVDELLPDDLGFDLGLKLGGEPVSELPIAVSLAIGDLERGVFRVEDLDEMEISFTDVEVGGGTFDGTITIGEIVEGVVQSVGGVDGGPQATGTFTITGGGDIGASVTLSGTHVNFEDGGGRLSLSGTAELMVGGTTGSVTFGVVFENGAPPQFSISEVSVQDLHIVTPVIELHSDEVAVNVQTGELEATNVSVVFPTFEGLTGSVQTLVINGDSVRLDGLAVWVYRDCRTGRRHRI